MKKNFYYIMALVLTIGLSACTKDEIDNPAELVVPETTGQITIVANIGDDASTRTSYTGDDQSGYNILWSEDDQITFYIGESVKQYFTYTLTEGAGTKSGVFTGPAVPNDIEYTAYAVYGENLSYALQGLLAEEQHYVPDNTASSFPMAAKATISNGQVTLDDFRNIGGLLRLDLKGSGTIKEIKVSAGQSLSGGIISIGEDGSASFTSNFGANKYVTLNCGIAGERLSSSEKPFYISLLKGDYTNVKIEIKDFAGHTFTKTLKADKKLNIARAQITPVAFTVTGLTNDNVPVTWDTPEGTRTMLDGRECIVVDFGSKGKSAIATMNVGSTTETGYGTYFAWLDAAKAQKNGSWGKGWHMPAIEEINDLCGAHKFASFQTNDYAVLQFSNGQYLPFVLGGFYDIGKNKYELQKQGADFWGSEIPALNTTATLTDLTSTGLTVYSRTFYCNYDYTIGAYKLPVRPFHRLPITRNTPVGAIGLIGDREAMVVEITINGAKKKVCIATKNEGANSDIYYLEQNGTAVFDCFGSYYTYAEAEALCTDGWYIPSMNEWKALYNSVPSVAVKEGYHTNNNFGSTSDNHFASRFEVSEGHYLYILDAGYDGSLHARGNRGSYWTSTYGSSNDKMLRLSTAYETPTYTYEGLKTDKNNLRLFHAMPK